MIDMKDLLDIIATEAVEGDSGGCSDYARSVQPAISHDYAQASPSAEPSFHYDLELIRRPDGTLEWIENP